MSAGDVREIDTCRFEPLLEIGDIRFRADFTNAKNIWGDVSQDLDNTLSFF